LTGAIDTSANLTAFLAKLERPAAPDPGAAQLLVPPVVGDPMDDVDPIRELVYSMLLWEAGASKAAAAARRLQESVVDVNELRSCLEDEIVRLIGPRYPRAAERAARMRAVLNQVYHDGNTVSLARLRAMNKREARTYLESLDGIPAFAAARVLLISLGGHAFPLDRRLHKVLADANAIEVNPYTKAAGLWVERQIRAGDALDAYLALEHCVDAKGGVTPKKSASKRSGAEGSSRRKSSDKSVT
jgi:endonuclease III